MTRFKTSASTNHNARFRRTKAVGLAAFCVGFMGLTGCGAVSTPNNLGEAEEGASDKQLTVSKVESKDCGLIEYGVSGDGSVTVTFNLDDAPEGRLWANAPDGVPSCITMIPFTVPAGKKFTPRNLRLWGVARWAHLTTYAYWLPGKVETPPGTGYGNQNAYSQHMDWKSDPNDPDGLFSFAYDPKLEDLESPTCDDTDKDKDVTLVVTLQRTVDNLNGNDERNLGSLLALDSMELAVGQLNNCVGPDKKAERGEACGWYDSSYRDCSNSNLVCVTSYREQRNPKNLLTTNAQLGERGLCVDQSPGSPDRPASLEAGEEEDCAGPFKVRCDEQEKLICNFKHPEATQSNDHYTGRCTPRLDVGEACDPKLFSVCNQYECSRSADPCKDGLQCIGAVCVTKQK